MSLCYTISYKRVTLMNIIKFEFNDNIIYEKRFERRQFFSLEYFK